MLTRNTRRGLVPVTEKAIELDLEACAQAAAVCACFNFRKASRAVTQHFDEQLQPTGLRSTQLVILLAVAVHESSGMAELARALVMDRSTLTRNLRPLINQGLLTLNLGQDRRTRLIQLTPEGRKSLQRAIPVWSKAQNEFVGELGADRWTTLLGLLGETVKIVWTDA
jgi:DNA-binding MarR family transcriptional regulator